MLLFQEKERAVLLSGWWDLFLDVFWCARDVYVYWGWPKWNDTYYEQQTDDELMMMMMMMKASVLDNNIREMW